MQTNKLLEYTAKFIAEVAHAEQVRKYTGEPYVVHPKAVAKTVSTVTDDSNMIAAALLHDVVEDTSFTIKDILSIFNEDIADLVSDLTDISKPTDGNRKIRKTIDRQHSAKASPRAKTIKLADLIDNSYSITQYDKNFAKVYMKEKKLLLKELFQGNFILWVSAVEIVENYYEENK